jgi:hypothetical protein
MSRLGIDRRKSGRLADRQTPGEAKFVYTGYAPKLWARVLFTGLLSFLIWNGPTNEVKEFIEGAPEFH